jgi:hypothetical protein
LPSLTSMSPLRRKTTSETSPTSWPPPSAKDFSRPERLIQPPRLGCRSDEERQDTNRTGWGRRETMSLSFSIGGRRDNHHAVTTHNTNIMFEILKRLMWECGFLAHGL